MLFFNPAIGAVSKADMRDVWNRNESKRDINELFFSLQKTVFSSWKQN